MAVEATAPFKLGHLLAKVDLKANQYGWVTIDANGLVDVAPSSIGAIGVQQNKPAAGQPVTIIVMGVTKLRVPKATAVAIGTAIGTCGYYLSANASANAPAGATGTHALVTAAINCIPRSAT
jgi:hypothetical protein